MTGGRHLDDVAVADAVEGAASARASSHLRACAVCRARVESERAIRLALAAGSTRAEAGEIPAGLAERTLRAMQRRRAAVGTFNELAAAVAGLARGLALLAPRPVSRNEPVPRTERNDP